MKIIKYWGNQEDIFDPTFISWKWKEEIKFINILGIVLLFKGEIK